MDKQKLVIYQLLPRLFGNKNTKLQYNGSRTENGSGKFNDITSVALNAIKELSVSHVWYTGVIEHAVVEGYPDNNIPNGNPLVIKGKAGSPYAIKDYYDVNPDLAVDVDQRMTEFKDLLDRTHKSGLKALIDFVPNHLAREYYSDMKPGEVDDFGSNDDVNSAFSPTNNYYYLPGEPLMLADEIANTFPNTEYHEEVARATGNDRFTPYPGINDWYETVKLNYGVDYLNGNTKHFNPVPDTWLKMEHVLKYWVQQGVDGFRCDMVEMVPVEFWEWVIPRVKQINSGLIFIAEVYNPAIYKMYIQQGQFDYLYDKVGLYDTLRGVVCNEQSASSISVCWQNLQGIDKHMLRFLENHDEQRIASQYFASNPKRAIPAMALSAYMHQGPVMLYNGQEVGETAAGITGYSGDDGRTSIFDYWVMPQHQLWMNGGAFDGLLLSAEQRELRQAYVDLLRLCQQPAISKGMFYDIMWHNQEIDLFNSHKLYAFIRYSKEQQLLVICNFDSESQFPYLKIPSQALDILVIPRPVKLSFTNLQTRLISSIGSEELISNGLRLELQAFTYCVLEVSY